MNNDLISRSALKEELMQEVSGNRVGVFFAKRVFDIINNAPAVAVDEEIERQREEMYQSSKKLFDTARMLGVERPHGEWTVTAEDNDGVHRICCPFCSYEKGSNNTDAIIVTFTNFPKFCENCGAKMEGGAE